MHFFRSHMVLKLERLYNCVLSTTTPGQARRRAYWNNRRSCFSTERIVERFRQVHRNPVSPRLW